MRSMRAGPSAAASHAPNSAARSVRKPSAATAASSASLSAKWR